MAAGGTATEGEAVAAAATAAVTAAATVTGTACRMSRERRTDQPPHTFGGMLLQSYPFHSLQNGYMVKTKGQNGYIVRSLVVPVGVLYDVCVLLCGQLLRRSIYEGQNHGPDHASELLCTYLISTTNQKAESNLKTMKSDPEVEVCPQGCQLGIHPEGWPHSVKGRRPGLRPLLLLPGSPSGQERTRVRAEQEERRVRRRREESLAELQVTVPACEVKCLR